MPKRFTDSRKWDDDFFAELTPKYKLLWLYMLDACDHAGLFKVIKKNINFHLDGEYDLDEILEIFKDKIIVVEEKLWFIPNFITFQYGNIDSGNSVHESVIKLLREKGLLNSFKRVSKGLANPCQRDKDKDQLKEQVQEQVQIQDQDKDKDPEIDKILLDTNINLSYSYEQFKSKYPRNKQNVQPGMTRALKVWSNSVNGHVTEIFKALENYCRSDNVTKGFIMNADKFLTDSWRDYLEFKKFGKDEQDGPIELMT